MNRMSERTNIRNIAMVAHVVHERGFAVVDVRNDGYVSDVRSFRHSIHLATDARGLPNCRSASKSTMPAAVARFRLRMLGLGIGIFRQRSQFARNRSSGSPRVSRPKTRQSSGSYSQSV